MALPVALPGVIYLDHAGTTATDPRVLEAMLPYFSQLYGNPSSIHTVGQEARHALDLAREKVSKVLHCRTNESLNLLPATRSNQLTLCSS